MKAESICHMAENIILRRKMSFLLYKRAMRVMIRDYILLEDFYGLYQGGEKLKKKIS
jgi:hypothetical protein